MNITVIASIKFSGSRKSGVILNSRKLDDPTRRHSFHNTRLSAITPYPGPSDRFSRCSRFYDRRAGPHTLDPIEGVQWTSP
jgi:hypothetical protein